MDTSFCWKSPNCQHAPAEPEAAQPPLDVAALNAATEEMLRLSRNVQEAAQPEPQSECRWCQEGRPFIPGHEGLQHVPLYAGGDHSGCMCHNSPIYRALPKCPPVLRVPDRSAVLEAVAQRNTPYAKDCIARHLQHLTDDQWRSLYNACLLVARPGSTAADPELDLWEKLARNTLPEGHPDAVWHEGFGAWVESNEALRRRIAKEQEK